MKEPKTTKTPAFWNLVGRFLERRRAKLYRAEAESQVAERDYVANLFVTNPDLHACVILTGRRLVHYLEMEDLAQIQARVADQPEIKCRWN